MGRLYNILKTIVDRVMYVQQEATFTFLGAGWYRLAELPHASSLNLLLSIAKRYNTGGGQGAIVALGAYYNTAKIQTLLPAPSGKSGITQIRVLMKASSPTYIDVYYSETSSQYANMIKFRTIGGVTRDTGNAAISFVSEPYISSIPSGYTAFTCSLMSAGGGITLTERRWQHEVVHRIKAACWPGEVWRRMAASWRYPDTVGSGRDCIGSRWRLRCRWREDDSILSQSVFRASVCVLLKQLYNVLGIGKYGRFNNHLCDDSVCRNKRTRDTRNCSLVRHRQSLISQEVAA